MNAKLAAAEARYAKAARAFEDADKGTWKYEVAQAEETSAWMALNELRFVPGVRVQAYREGKPAMQGTVRKLHEDFYVEVIMDGERGGTRIFANQLTVIG